MQNWKKWMKLSKPSNSTDHITLSRLIGYFSSKIVNPGQSAIKTALVVQPLVNKYGLTYFFIIQLVHKIQPKMNI